MFPEAATNRIDLTVGRDVFLEAGSTVDLKGKGFVNRSGPGYKAAGTAHAGRNAVSTANYVGRVDRPDLPGSAGDGAGGGAVRIAAGGTLALDGTITADAADVGNGAGTSGAGGSVWLMAKLFVGSGSVSANGGTAYGGTCGGGGRIAFVQETDGDLSAWRPLLTARGGKNQGGAVASGAGTVYLKAGRFADVFVDNAGGEGVTAVPSPADSKKTWRTARVTVSGGGDVQVLRDVKLRDLDLAAKTAKLHLNGKVLTIVELTHENRMGWLGTVTEDGGEIRWTGDKFYFFFVR